MNSGCGFELGGATMCVLEFQHGYDRHHTRSYDHRWGDSIVVEKAISLSVLAVYVSMNYG